MVFVLHSNLAKKPLIIDLPLCRLLLEDNRHYPWLLLVPRQGALSRMMDLSLPAQWQLLQELDWVQRVMWAEFQPTQLNIAAIGNKTPQLHIHVIARYENDPAWPHTVWDHSAHAKYDDDLRNARILRLQHLFSPKQREEMVDE